VFIVDYLAGTRRYGLKEDVMKGIALVQGLDNIPDCNALTVPSDVHPDMTDVISHQLIYKYSKKPGGTYILTPNSARWIIEMARLTGNGTGYGLETVSPLQFRKESLDMAMVFADTEFGYWIGPMVMAGATAPVTLAGALTMENTEILASIFLAKALDAHGTYYSSPCHTMDLRTMLCSFGAPAQALLGIGAAQMGMFYGLRSSSNSGLTDALYPDFQGGFEKSMNAMFSLLGGTTGIGCQGIVGADMGISMEQLVLDNEWIDSYNYVMKGFTADVETIAEDLIQELGIGGNFLAEEHTVAHLRESQWETRLFNRNAWDANVVGGGKTLLSRAHERVEALTAGYREMEPVLDPSTCERLDYLVKCASEELLHD
jgi:trimethylamine--corrinoid protein Co-methyltransferase